MAAIADMKHLEGAGLRARVQRVGGYMAGMVMPNISAFIAWGLITALFIPTGWLPNEKLATLVGPMIFFLLPILIGYTGGRLVHGQRGAVVGAVATMGVIVPAAETLLAPSDDAVGVPMFLGAMIMGPVAAFILKMVDGYVQERTRAGFEMLVDNFSAGIVGAGTAVAGVYGVGPVVEKLTTAAGNGVDWLVDNSLLPLVSVIVEPAKVLFLNNAINHGVLAPLAVTEAADKGKSILFMIETNPGPGLGILTAYLLFGPRSLRPTVPGAMIIHFLGGIHEIYFPYILMKPKLILAAIAGGMSGVATAQITNAGLIATPAPGSIFAYLAETPKGGYVAVLLSVIVAAGVSFGVGSVLLGFGRGEKESPLETPEEAGTHTVAPPRAGATAAAAPVNRTVTTEA
jgi:mannitol PTS system EIICBA or EIICB component